MNDRIPTDPMLEARLARLQQRSGAASSQRGASAASQRGASAASQHSGAASGERQHTQLHRPSPATGTKIATTGFAAATIFGMVTAMTWSQHAVAAKNAAATTVPPTAAPTTAATVAPKVIVRVHHVKAGSAAAVKAATPAKKKTGTVRSNAPTSVKKKVVAPPVQKAPVSTCTATSKVACP